jgi:hypothetical protein
MLQIPHSILIFDNLDEIIIQLNVLPLTTFKSNGYDKILLFLVLIVAKELGEFFLFHELLI